MPRICEPREKENIAVIFVSGRRGVVALTIILLWLVGWLVGWLAVMLMLQRVPASSAPPVVSASATDNGIVRHAINANVPIAVAVAVAVAIEVPAAISMVYFSVKLPPVQDSNQNLDSPLAYGGDPQAQKVAVMREIDKALLNIGLGLGDVMKVQVFLVGEPALGNKMDLKGFAAGYAQSLGLKRSPTCLPAPRCKWQGWPIKRCVSK